MLIIAFSSNYLSLLLEKISKESKFCFLMGDFNINLPMFKLTFQSCIRKNLGWKVTCFRITWRATMIEPDGQKIL